MAAAAVLGVAPRTGASDPAAMLARGENPHPVQLTRPPAAPLSAMAQLGKRIFLDTSLSASGRLSCASCHDPANHYGPPPHTGPVMLGGPDLTRQGLRAVPTLTYLERQPGFTIGPDTDETETAPAPQAVALHVQGPRPEKIAGDPAASAVAMVPQGGLFWDGRVDTLQEQALQPLLNPLEMANASAASVATKLRHARYAQRFVPLFGPSILRDPRLLLSEAMFAVARYQIEDPAFHPYTSKYDDWLEGKLRLTPSEMRGYALFNDPRKANCAGCHLDQPRPDGTPPRFTDGQFEALGVPRNTALSVNRDPHFFDLGLCGPERQDMRADTQYCGMFLTPTLRNVATRHAFFHNGVFRSLQQVLDFYRLRDVDPAKVYPAGVDGKATAFNDIPPQYRGNVDVTDPPFDRKPGEPPAFNAQDARDIIAFLQTLTDGYKLKPAAGKLNRQGPEPVKELNRR